MVSDIERLVKALPEGGTITFRRSPRSCQVDIDVGGGFGYHQPGIPVRGVNGSLDSLLSAIVDDVMEVGFTLLTPQAIDARSGDVAVNPGWRRIERESDGF